MTMERLLGVREFAEPAWLIGVWLAPLALLIVLLAIVRRRRALARFAERDLLDEIASPVGSVRLVTRAVLVCAALGLIAVGLSRPLWDKSERTIRREGRDVVFIVDVSRSMLADDLAPNRLERTKLWIRDVIPTLDGDRVGLVAFAGAAVVKCPLTLDYAYFDLALSELATDSVSLGGTMIGDALRKATGEIFDQFEGRYRDVLLFTDGEDQGSAPIDAARAASERGVRLIAFGLGSDTQGTLVPDPDRRGRFIEDRVGNPVRSRLDRDTLEAMARSTQGGVYVHVGTGNVELDRLYADLVKDAAKSVVREETIVEYDQRFQAFLGLALTMLIASAFIGGLDP